MPLDETGMDTLIRTRTALRPAAFCPEIVLWTADEFTDLWEATEEDLNTLGLGAPFWSIPWAGGQALARSLLVGLFPVVVTATFDKRDRAG